ncbi:hypothetical protein [Burkholderia pyrrocinia]|uniref:hypothetical protein n=1 Tax=Burkholderia pyrrocinia TaxID=60550 RepID=UPI001575AA7B|nr:hypothetical protein [Burkholderia pyrrocinia]
MNDNGGYARLAWLSQQPLASTVMMERRSPFDCSGTKKSSPRNKGRFMLAS